MGKYIKSNLIRVSPKAFRKGNKLNYNVFKKDVGTLYKKHIYEGQAYTAQDIKSLKDASISYLYIDQNDFEKHSTSMNKNISNIIISTEISSLEKAEIIHDLAADTMYELLSGDITKSKINQVSQSIDLSVEFMLTDPNAIKSMIEVTSHDYYTFTHCVGVSTYALTFGKYLGLSELELKTIGKGAMLHDIGKKRVPIEIINKKGKLTEEEFSIMKNHPSYGIDILKEMNEKCDITLAIAKQHHEKLSGNGYPKGLKKDQIHPFAEIVMICDIFSALTTKRSYKKEMTSIEAFEIMYKQMNNELNLKLLTKFIKFMGTK